MFVLLLFGVHVKVTNFWREKNKFKIWKLRKSIKSSEQKTKISEKIEFFYQKKKVFFFIQKVFPVLKSFFIISSSEHLKMNPFIKILNK